jgi:2-aminoethylphosphonate-pyruvate transaminase
VTGGQAPRRRLLFTPGPLTMSARVRDAMREDRGSRDPAFVALGRDLVAGLSELLEAGDGQALVPLQGSGTFAVEAMIGSLVPPAGRLLVVENGVYAERIARIARTIGRDVDRLVLPATRPVDPAAVEAALAQDPSVTHVAAVHLETVAGLVNPIEAIARVVERSGRRLLVDAMSTFGALDLRAGNLPCEALAFSSNKCLQGPPGLGFVLARISGLEAGRSPSLALDLHAQWRAWAADGQWRFTPPTHVLAGTHEALRELVEEGGPAKRLERYAGNFEILRAGCRDLGLATVLDEAFLSPIILALRNPDDPRFDFEDLYRHLAARDLYIYPGNLAGTASFRIGCIGDLHRADMLRLLAAIGDYWDLMALSRPGG